MSLVKSSPVKRYLTPFYQAVSLLTILPVRSPEGEVPMSRVMGWFPVVGAVVGAAAGGLFLACAQHWPDPVAAGLAVAALAVLTGGLHLDGFADTVDGLAAWKGKEETLRIMKDSHLGVLAAAALFLLLGLQWALLEALPMDQVLGALVAACALSRASLVLSAHLFPYVPGKEGLGRLLTDHRSAAALLVAMGLGIGISAVCVGPVRALLCAGTAAGVSWLLNNLFRERLGGITGDTLGAVNEAVTLAILFLLAVR